MCARAKVSAVTPEVVTTERESRRGAGGESHPAPVFLNAYFSRWIRDDSGNIEKMDFLSAMPRWFNLASGVKRQERKWPDFFLLFLKSGSPASSSNVKNRRGKEFASSGSR